MEEGLYTDGGKEIKKKKKGRGGGHISFLKVFNIHNAWNAR
jgi:hypothetical protein